MARLIVGELLLDTHVGLLGIWDLLCYRSDGVELNKCKTGVCIVGGHTTLKTPVLVRSPKLSNVGPG